MVYDEVFGPTRVITPKRYFKVLSGDQRLQPEVYIKPLVHTSILATNKKVYDEALDTLYRGRTVRGSIRQLIELLRNDNIRPLLRRIEIDDHFKAFQNPRATHMLLRVLRTLHVPRIRSVTILSDKFAFAQHKGRAYITVREFATWAHLGEAICVNIGRFQLCGKFSHIQIVYRKLVKMWPNVVSTPEDYDVYADMLGLLRFHGYSIFPALYNAAAWAAHTFLRRWVGLYNEVLRAEFGLNHYLMGKSTEQQALLVQFVRSARCLQHQHPGSFIPSYARYVHESRSRHRLMNTLRPSDDHEMLAWATDILSVNIAGFHPSLQGNDRQAYFQLAHWAETDGGMHTLDIMKMHISSALRGDVDAIYVSHPVFPGFLEYTSKIQSSLIGYPMQILHREPADLSPQRIRQLYLLQLAMDFWRYSLIPHQQVVDGWSLRLFQRYLLADPSVHEDEANRATLEDMRTIIRTILISFASPETSFHKKAARLRRTKEPVAVLDPDLVPALAWEYGRVVVEGWRDMLSIRRYLSFNSISAAALPHIGTPSAPP